MPRPRKTPAEVSAARSAVAKIGWSYLTPEQRSERGRIAASARKENGLRCRKCHMLAAIVQVPSGFEVRCPAEGAVCCTTRGATAKEARANFAAIEHDPELGVVTEQSPDDEEWGN